MMKLCAVAAVPFVGFGIADNFIMIVAGDSIDNHLGAVMGISTLAAAGLGNLLSDVVGLRAGDLIEAWCHKAGLREPNLSPLQMASQQVKRVRSVAAVVGISVGCLIGMLPLHFINDRKALYFNEQELTLYETFFQPFGVTAPDFFELMKHGQWRSLEAGGVMVPAGKPFEGVVLLHRGAASAFIGPKDEAAARLGQERPKLYNYRGRGGGDAGPEARAGEVVRGSIIGGSALVDQSVLGLPYPNTVEAVTRVEYVEWRVSELREQMANNKAVEAAVFSTLYLDLVEGFKQQHREAAEAAEAAGERAGGGGAEGAAAPVMGAMTDDRSAKQNEFSILMRAVMSDGRIHTSERRMVREYMAENNLSPADLRRHLTLNGWTEVEWQTGQKKDHDDKASRELQTKIQSIPGMLRQANIRSRVVARKDTGGEAPQPPGEPDGAPPPVGKGSAPAAATGFAK